MGKLILIRHGETDLNRDKVFFGHLDPSLNPNGIGQIEKCKETFTSIEYDRILVSPLKRARESAEILNYKKLNIEVVEELKEINFGIFEGLTYDEICEKYPSEVDISWNQWKEYNFVNGESPTMLQERVVRFIESNMDLAINNVIVAHWGVISTILSHYLSNGIEGYWKFGTKNGGIIILSFEENFPVLESFNLGV